MTCNTQPEQPSVIIVETNHKADPPVGTVLRILDHEGDEVIVGWSGLSRRPSDTARWPMLREHVRPAVSEGVA